MHATADPALDLSASHRIIVQDILARLVPGREVWAFGSRVRGRAKPFSDLDLAIIGDQPLPIATTGALAEAFEESDLPWRVDVVDWATTSAAFHQIIARDHRVLQRAR